MRLSTLNWETEESQFQSSLHDFISTGSPLSAYEGWYSFLYLERHTSISSHQPWSSLWVCQTTRADVNSLLAYYLSPLLRISETFHPSNQWLSCEALGWYPMLSVTHHWSLLFDLFVRISPSCGFQSHRTDCFCQELWLELHFVLRKLNCCAKSFYFFHQSWRVRALFQYPTEILHIFLQMNPQVYMFFQDSRKQ